ncbi:50S ribosomal protein L11 [Candidatus Gottesmanbacteria bacterium RIFCSPHIGHO2_01_FULL_42_12]|uniref:Large ribosomal subunit protein uL11 n=1 Tax=Candidatus Gottesmanbacteria bacterium RIFCSPHIGHO2_01_FULL_42_12 TaxID=1798377 RepID=A0A1F5Z5P6_9BACT|nr:MAG: 50S ribosomal protein L11 [Candidatus Gottesmanbacteria bacterium RIFCSPHIGHO2_01_FULL_42_12]
MAKKIKTIIKLNLQAGAATPAPPVGPALGQHGLPIMDFVKAYNDKTADKKGQVIPAVITVYEDRTFTFITKLPPVSELIKKSLGLTAGSKKPGREPIGTITQEQARKIAETKMEDLNANGDVEAATKIVLGTARSMGLKAQ